ncbi:MAG TPA: chemotaxis protein CheW [Dyella sp.]|uniref:chemotaxis protein CheW n=1 Tax=Dyella sp. TaxID=1869338 RepID=UPI002F95E01D
MSAVAQDTVVASQWLVFFLAGQAYAAPLTQVNEIVRDGAVTPVPGSAEDLLGIRLLRGQIVPVLDGRQRLGLDEQTSSPAQGRIVVLTHDSHQVGVRVDAVDELLSVNESDMAAPPAGRAVRADDPVRGVVPWKQGFVALLDVRKLCRLPQGAVLGE